MKNVLKQLLDSGNYITINKNIIKMIGLLEAVLLGNFISKYNYFDNKNMLTEDDEFFNTIDRIIDETGLKRNQIMDSIKTLSDFNILTVTKKGLPAKNYYKLNFDKILKMFSKKHKKITSDIKFKPLVGLNLNHITNTKESNIDLDLDRDSQIHNIKRENLNNYYNHIKEIDPSTFLEEQKLNYNNKLNENNQHLKISEYLNNIYIISYWFKNKGCPKNINLGEYYSNEFKSITYAPTEAYNIIINSWERGIIDQFIYNENQTQYKNKTIEELNNDTEFIHKFLNRDKQIHINNINELNELLLKIMNRFNLSKEMIFKDKMFPLFKILSYFFENSKDKTFFIKRIYRILVNKELNPSLMICKLIAFFKILLNER